nr:EamA family transporter RarD [Roseospira visakhapatnamensis]
MAAFGAYVFWGLSPVLYHLLGHVAPLEVMAHRIVWALLFALPLVVWFGQVRTLVTLLRQPRVLLVFTASALAVSINWLTFIYATGSGHKLDSSMGYYIFPLATVLLGAVVLGERPNARQGVAIGLAVLGVLVMLVGLGRLPWIALVLASSFGIYGLLRKIAPAEALVGFTLEVILLAPLAIGFLVWLHANGQGVLATGSTLDVTLVMVAGPATALPLLLFAMGARRLPLGTLGMLQYINPTLQFGMAVLIFDEPFTVIHTATFALVWAGVALYAIDPARLRRWAGRRGSRPAG